MANNRKDGFYWVRIYSGWIVCEWDSTRGRWKQPGTMQALLERNIDTIYEIPIPPPKD